MNELAVLDFLFDFNTVYVEMDLSATVWPLTSTFGFRKTGNGVGERRLTSNETVMVERRDIWCRIAKNAINDA